MKTYHRRKIPVSMQLAQVCIAWGTLFMAAGVVAPNVSGSRALAGDGAGVPTAGEIYRAIDQAEAQASAVRPVG